MTEGFTLNKNMKCVPVRYTKDALPDELLCRISREESESEQPKDDEQEEDIDDGDEIDELDDDDDEGDGNDEEIISFFHDVLCFLEVDGFLLNDQSVNKHSFKVAE